MKGKCLLDQTGIADPTGCGEGFSYVRVSAKPQKAKVSFVSFIAYIITIYSLPVSSKFASFCKFLQEEVTNVPKRLVTGTNADLRKLPLKEAKEICRDYGVREEEVFFLNTRNLHFRGQIRRFLNRGRNFHFISD